jgi:ketosteroid isomerase-like protein
VVREFLTEAFDPRKLSDAVTRLVAVDATYVSLNFDNPELRRIMPWAGTKHGRNAFAENFAGVTKCWKDEAFQVMDTISEGECVALFGSFTLRSRKLVRVATSAFAVLAKVRDDRITYFQFMEDTFATAQTFRSGGAWRIEADPDATEPIEV